MSSWDDVPIDRLLTNLKAREDRLWFWQNADRANLEFQIGRLYSMAFAQKAETGKIKKGVGPETALPFPQPQIPDFRQPTVVRSPADETSPIATKHLEQAIFHLDKAVALDPSLIAARLGLAWCEDQAGNKQRAITLYREVFAQGFRIDGERRDRLAGMSVTVECGHYLSILLDPIKDAKEIAEIKSKISTMQDKFRAVTPILIPLTKKADVGCLLQKSKVEFNLDGNGERECTEWLANDAGWLVYNPDQKGNINSGLSLIGEVTFWVFWKNGYEVLEALDNDQDGKLTGSELTDLAIWRDTNGDGIAQAGEVRPLSFWNIAEISCYYESAPSGRRRLLLNPKGVTLQDGTTRPTYDVWIEQRP